MKSKITDEAQKLYQKHKESVYQIRCVSKLTGKKSAIGSGFQFTEEGHIATNYHVISEAVQRPDEFTIESIHFDNTVSVLEIIDFDIIHDLAIVKNNNANTQYFKLNNAQIHKGTKIFSMGNPYDLGMTIVEGLYNGLMEKSLFQKILFSGSLNSGMSGGPALNHEGEVIGINVATKGNQVSFLLPVNYLSNLYDKSALSDRNNHPKNWDLYVQDQLLASQQQKIDNLIEEDWDHLSVGKARVPGEITESFKCWSNTKDYSSDLYSIANIDCFNDDLIYIDSQFYTGNISFIYKWAASKGLNVIRFYNFYERIFSRFEPFDNAKKKDVSNFSCHTDFVKIDRMDSKMVLCARHYKKYPLIHDISISIASVNKNDKGLIIGVKALGLTKNSATKFIKKFLGEIRWVE